MILKKFLNCRSLPIGTKKRHCTKVFSRNEHLENHLLSHENNVFFVPMGKLRQFKNFFEIIFLGKTEVNVYLQNGPNFNLGLSKHWKSKNIFSLKKFHPPFFNMLFKCKKLPKIWKMIKFGLCYLNSTLFQKVLISSKECYKVPNISSYEKLLRHSEYTLSR